MELVLVKVSISTNRGGIVSKVFLETIDSFVKFRILLTTVSIKGFDNRLFTGVKIVLPFLGFLFSMQ